MSKALWSLMALFLGVTLIWVGLQSAGDGLVLTSTVKTLCVLLFVAADAIAIWLIHREVQQVYPPGL
ncbi:MAG: hypothetical protein GXY32_00835 [Ruminococcaceae bacterium]|nr:hypothetical protein [Oscillospiraceae bacterium]